MLRQPLIPSPPESPGRILCRDSSTATGVVPILLLALALRAGWALVFASYPVSDAHAYQQLARQLARGGYYGFDGTPYTYWPVGYPFFLSVEMRLLGAETRLLTAVEVLLGTGVVALAMLLCAQWSRSPRAVWLTGLILAVYPTHVQFASITSSESLFTVLLLSAFCCWGNLQAPPFRRAFSAGLLLGLATYVRPVALPLASALFIGHWLKWRQPRSTCVPAVVMLAAALVVLAPWMYRNYRVYGRFVMVSTNGGMCLYFGNNPDAPGACQELVYPRDFRGNDAERDEYCRTRAMAYIRSDLMGFIERSLRKAIIMWERDTIGIAWNPGIELVLGVRGALALKVLNQAFWIAFLCLCAVAVPWLWRKEGHVAVAGSPCLWACLILTLLHGVTYSQDRYHYACVPLLALLVAEFLAVHLSCRVRPWPWRPWAQCRL